MGGLGSWWGTRQEDMNEDSAERREREAWVPRQELKLDFVFVFQVRPAGRRGSRLDGREKHTFVGGDEAPVVDELFLAGSM